MGEVAAAAAFSPWRRRPPLSLPTRAAGLASDPRPPRRARTTTRAATHSAEGAKPPGFVTFSAGISTDIPFYEPPGVSFDDYISDRPRVFRAMFPDQRRSKRLNDDEWMIQMLPLQFLFMSTRPIVVMRLHCRSGGKRYPAGVPLHATTVLDLQATRWELQGLDAMYMPANFTLGVQGALYADRTRGSHGGGSRLTGCLEMSIGMVLPPVLALLPQDIVKAAAETVLKALVEKMKQEVDVGLLSDFGNFRREKLRKRNHGEAPALHPLPATVSAPIATEDLTSGSFPS